MTITSEHSSDQDRSGSTSRPWIWIVVALVVVGGLAALTVTRSRPAPQASASVPAPSDASTGIACLGRIEPEDGVVVLGARSISGQPSLIEQILVKEGDSVTAGQTLAVLNSRAELAATGEQANAQVELARTRLAQVRAGAKAADIQAQQAEVIRLQKALDNAEVEHRRNQQLHADKAITTSALDASRLNVETQRQLLDAAQQRLKSLSEVRQVDVDVAERELRVAMAEAQRARATLDQAVVKAPFRARVIKILRWPGEDVGPNGIMELGKTDQMFVLAEVPESDIRRLRVGAAATITADSLDKQLTGNVDRIGIKVAKNDVLPMDPASFADARIVETRIRLDDSARAQSLIHGRVNVVIRP